MYPVEISPAQRQEAGVIARLVNDAYHGSAGDSKGWTGVAHLLGGPRIAVAEVAAYIDDSKFMLLVARDHGECVGCILLTRLRPGVGEISLLSVALQRQGAGLGRALVRSGEAWMCGHWQCTDAELTVLSPRPELEDWYRRLGYAETGRCRALGSDGEGYGTPKSPSLFLMEFARRISTRIPNNEVH